MDASEARLSNVCAAAMLPHATARHRIFNVHVDPFNADEAIATILGWCRSGQTEIVVNPNLDCVVKLLEYPQLADVYDDAGLVLVDGWPLSVWSRLRGRAIPRVAGSDLMVPLCRAAARERFSVFLFGTTLESLAGAARVLVQAIPDLDIAGVYSPPYGFQHSAEETDMALDVINRAAPSIIFLALGAPKQEFWAQSVRSRIRANGLVCVGASIDFLSGRVARAPHVFRMLYLEWFWRVLIEPRRLAPRYLRLIAALPSLVWSYGR